LLNGKPSPLHTDYQNIINGGELYLEMGASHK
jgi:hypothetical protein